jgi:hypothetical protein
MNSTSAGSSSLENQEAPDIPEFELLRQIGQGGFGRVWLARNRTTGQLRAIKVIPRSRVGTADPAGREIVAITLLDVNLRRQHPNLLSVHHVGQTREHLFYVMDLADDAAGQTACEPSRYEPATLKRRLADGPLEPEQCLDCARKLLSGLALLHQTGMVHRDVKPANCLFVGGELKLADFGLLTQSGLNVSCIGTEKYMPPDGRMDARADVYAAGLVIYEMITGFSPDRFPQLGRRSGAIAADAALSVLMRLALKACQPDPEERFTGAADMLAALEREIREGPRKFRLRRWIALVAAGAAIAGAVTLGGYWFAPPARVHVNFISYPFGATILLDGRQLLGPDGTPVETPCTVENLPAGAHQVTFRHLQLPDLDAGMVDFGTTRQVVARWKSRPLAPNTVDLPDLPSTRGVEDR